MGTKKFFENSENISDNEETGGSGGGGGGGLLSEAPTPSRPRRRMSQCLQGLTLMSPADAMVDSRRQRRHASMQETRSTAASTSSKSENHKAQKERSTQESVAPWSSSILKKDTTPIPTAPTEKTETAPTTLTFMVSTMLTLVNGVPIMVGMCNNSYANFVVGSIVARLQHTGQASLKEALSNIMKMWEQQMRATNIGDKTYCQSLAALSK